MSSRNCLQKNLGAFGAMPRRGKGQKRVAFGVVVITHGGDEMTTAKNAGMWYRGVKKGVEALDNAWRRADLQQLQRVAPARGSWIRTVVACAILFHFTFLLSF